MWFLKNIVVIKIKNKRKIYGFGSCFFPVDKELGSDHSPGSMFLSGISPLSRGHVFSGGIQRVAVLSPYVIPQSHIGDENAVVV